MGPCTTKTELHFRTILKLNCLNCPVVFNDTTEVSSNLLSDVKEDSKSLSDVIIIKR